MKVASCAVALSIAVMLASIAVVQGFKQEITKKVVGFNADIQLYAMPGYSNDNTVTLTSGLNDILDTVAFIKSYALQVSAPAVLKTTDDFKGIYLRSSTDSASRAFVKSNLLRGDTEGLVISKSMANHLGLDTADRIDCYFFADELRARRFTVSGVYDSHFDNYDDVVAYTDLPVIQKATSLPPDRGSSIKIATTDFNRLPQDAQKLQYTLNRAAETGIIDRPLQVSTALASGAGYFQWLALLDTNVAVILTLMTLVGCATLTGGMLIMILDKKRIIGLLKALGAPTPKVRRIFIYLAMRVALAGMLIGNAVMLLFLWAQHKWHVIPLDPDTYYIDFVPVFINWTDVLILNAGVMAIVYLALILPSRAVASISPAETMRHE